MTREELMQMFKDCDSFTMVYTDRKKEQSNDYYETLTVYTTKNGTTVKREGLEQRGAYNSVRTWLISDGIGYEFCWSNWYGEIADSYENIDVEDVKTKEEVLNPDHFVEAEQIASWPYKISNNQVVFEIEDEVYIKKIVIKDFNYSQIIIPEKFKNYKDLPLTK